MLYATAAEVEKLISARDKIEGDYNKLAFDSFIFNCECGLLWNYLSNLSKSDFKKRTEGYVLTKELHKGNEKFASESLIPIVTPLLVEIIEKYDFHFELKRNSFYNRTLRNLFKKHELFTEPITVKKKYIKGGVESKDVLRNDVITCHSCRWSMITNAFKEGHNIAQVMQMSGHKNLKTLQKYSNFANKELLEMNIEQKLNRLKQKSDDIAE